MLRVGVGKFKVNRRKISNGGMPSLFAVKGLDVVEERTFSVIVIPMEGTIPLLRIVSKSDGSVLGEFKGSSQHPSIVRFAMEKKKRRQTDRALRPKMRSPGHPPGWRREHQQRFLNASSADKADLTTNDHDKGPSPFRCNC